ncbi:fe-s cluster assembly factor hcf101 chloroplastic [Phtheirospermum japonicum]|uniref:Fe-s cluster assembly factor hcf101 chloroplastic n=1 Tax=Phtheirospermum japonicum TaxID=374723 RepID=A0A830CFR5_9LAMI|nr:fe-s cluster assembly factor hcf101 chloroplastic [Phtheirospermum japonicum]
MQLLHAPFSHTLPFHCSKARPAKYFVERVPAISFSSEKYFWVPYSGPSCSSISPKAASSQGDHSYSLASSVMKDHCVTKIKKQSMNLTAFNSDSSTFSSSSNQIIIAAAISDVASQTAETDVLKALSQIIDPDFGTDIVSCGFVKDLNASMVSGEVSFRLELTTPACPVKDMFEQKAHEVVAALPWVEKVKVTMSAQPARPVFAGQLPAGLQTISNVVAVSSCKGGVGKSTVAVNLAYTLAGMGARVGIFDADVYGPSLPTMVSPENRLLEMNPEKRTIIPTEYMGVKLVSFGFAGQGRAIMRGPMVSGVIDQLLTTTEW